MSEYDDYEYGDYTVVLTPGNVDEIAKIIKDNNPNFPTYVFYDFAETVFGEEMLFSEFMDRLHESLQEEIDRTLLQMVKEENLEMFCTKGGNIVFGSVDSIEESSGESELKDPE
jgi:hypothetical protein